MSRTAADITPEELAVYRRNAIARHQARLQALKENRERALKTATRAACFLKEEFGAARVSVFGSLVAPTLFHIRSDIDLAVWELPGRDYCRAVGRLQSLDEEFEIDLIAFEEAPPRLQARILKEGKML